MAIFDQKITFLVFGDLLIKYDMFWNHFSRFGHVYWVLKFFHFLTPTKAKNSKILLKNIFLVLILHFKDAYMSSQEL